MRGGSRNSSSVMVPPLVLEVSLPGKVFAPHHPPDRIRAAARPMLRLSGDEDGVAPVSGIEVLEAKLAKTCALYGKPENFRSVIDKRTGHEYLKEMKAEMIAWFDKHRR